ncbi:hypothetical protein D3C86_1437510 [compost metagenome]
MENNQQPLNWINSHYGLNASIGQDILLGNRKGTISKDMGNYIGITFHDDTDNTYPCHPTSGITYLDSRTDLSKFKKKNWRSKQRYQDYREACEWYGGYFFDYLRDEKLIKSGKYFD